MTTNLHLLLLFSLLTVTCSTAQPFFFLAGITKDATTLQYTTRLHMGTPQFPVKLVVHLSGQSLWAHCSPSSSSRQFIRHGSLPCSMAKSGGRATGTVVDHIRTTTATTTTTICDIHEENPVTGAAAFGDLAESILASDGMDPAGTVDRFLFSCVPDYLLKGLASGAKGILGLGRSKTAFPSQIVNSFGFPRKFTVCLSSSEGFINSGTGVSKSLSYTPLVSPPRPTKEQYHVTVNSIKINGKRLVLHGGAPAIGEVQISTILPYTTMKTTIYKIFTEAFIHAADSMNMTMVAPVAPFGVCFSSSGATVPEIELVLQSEMVKWKIQERNSMVKVKDSVICLGFLDGGSDMSDSIVLGGYQLEDHIMEFDLGTGMMGFSSSLLMEGKSCSAIKESISTPKESVQYS